MEDLINRRDLLLRLCSRLNNKSLKLLSYTSLWEVVKGFSEDQYFWYLRIQYHFKSCLEQRIDEDWRTSYHLLIKTDIRRPFTCRVLPDKLSVAILLELGHDPSANDNRAIVHASDKGYTEVVRLLLEDPRVDPSIYGNSPLRCACKNGHTEVVRLLLLNTIVDRSTVDVLISYACEYGHFDIVDLLLVEEVYSEELRRAIKLASESGRSEVLRILYSNEKK